MAGGIDTAVGAGIPGSTVGIGALATAGGYPFWDWLVKNQLIPAIIEGRNNSVPMLGLLYKRKRTVGGKFIVQPVRDGRNYAGISAIHPDGNMPDPGQQGAYNYATAVRDIYLRMKIHNQLLHRAEGGDDGALVDLITYETEGLMQDLAIKQEIMLHGDGSGRRAEVSSVSTTTLTVRLNQDNEGVATCTSAPNLYLDIGMRIAFVTAAGSVKATAGGVQAVYVVAKPSSNTIQCSTTLGGSTLFDFSTISTPGALAAGDWIVDASRDASMSSITGIPLDTAWRQEPMGLAGVFRDVGVLDGIGISVAGQQTGAFDYTDTSITANAVGFQGVPVNGAPTSFTYPAPTWNKAIVLDNAGVVRPVSDSLLQKLVSDARRRNNAAISLFVSDWDMYSAYLDTLIGDKRYVSNVIKGGHSGDQSGDGNVMGGVSFNDIPWMKSRFALANQIIGLDPGMFSIYENRPLSPSQPPGHTPWERVRDKDAFWKAFSTSYNMLCELRERAGAILVDVA